MGSEERPSSCRGVLNRGVTTRQDFSDSRRRFPPQNLARRQTVFKILRGGAVGPLPHEVFQA
jgi:hypothetical protein